MEIKPGQIVKNLIPNEPVEIMKITPLGGSVSISYTGINTKKSNTRVIPVSDFEQLEVVAEQGSFNFQGDPVKFSLVAEAERINSAYQFDPLFAVNSSIVDPLPHQVEAVYKYLLPLPKIRFLLADDTGAGKTIMAGLLIKELMLRGVIERILIITPGGLTKQWQEDELEVKFNLKFKLVNRSILSSEPTVFHNSSMIVTSIDFIAREDVLNAVKNSHWDLIIFDEAHKLSAYDYGRKNYKSLRYNAAEVLSQQCEHILLLTATPHRGRKDTFKKLLQLLDQDIFATNELATARIREVEKSGANKFFIRRLKEDMRDWADNPLYKNRYTQTVSYELTPEEKELYDAVTEYLTKKKEEASETKNIHVSLALTVMQRRLASSIFAIKNTLYRRWQSLQAILDELRAGNDLLNQKTKVAGYDIDDIEEYDDLDDEEREQFDEILSDPRKFKLYTTGKTGKEIQKEVEEVKYLYDMAVNLYNSNQEEKKFQELQELLRANGVLDQGEKLVIFTENRDTLTYLEERLTKGGGYKVATIHGGKLVDDRRQAQWDFAKPETQILIATDAAGEGINLQFCRLLINWDIPWNPNRLEQRMGRIHRYGQKKDVLVFNMVAGNTKEGAVLQRLLQKLDIIRESMGDDRVYDVIQDVLEDVRMEAIINSVFNGEETELDQFLAQDDEQLKKRFQEKIEANRNALARSIVDYKDAKGLKENSDEKRLQPIYVKLFFEKAFGTLGGKFTEVRPNIYSIERIPEGVIQEMQQSYNIYVGNQLNQLLFCFDKQVFLDYQNVGDLGKLHYINPGNSIFDSLVKVVRNQFHEEMLKGTVLISPEDKQEYFAFFVRSQIADQRERKRDDSIADERLYMVYRNPGGDFQVTSPAKFLDLHPPKSFAKPIQVPEVMSNSEVVQWVYQSITLDQLKETQQRVETDAADRRGYLQTAFTQLILELQEEIQELQAKVMMGDNKSQDVFSRKIGRINELKEKKIKRLEDLDLMQKLHPKEPEVMGCAYVVPLTQVEYHQHFGMSRDDEVEAIAMEVALQYEQKNGWTPEDVSANNEGYDIRSVSPDQIKRYIEVKGRAGEAGDVMLSENEMNRLGQLGASAWLYIVLDCKDNPKLYRINDPIGKLVFEKHYKGVQYLLKNENWDPVIYE